MESFSTTNPPVLPHCFAVRLTYPNNMIPLTFWRKLHEELCEGVFATEHNTRNPHIHMACYNSLYTHDVFRKKLVGLVKECIEDDPPKGNKLMSVKAWNLNRKYLVYMLKGRKYEVVENNLGLTAEYIEHLRSLWHEDQSQAGVEYDLWEQSDLFPKVIIVTRSVEEMYAARDDSLWITKSIDVSFDTIVEKAKEFGLRYHSVTKLDGTVKYMVKNLISNYCHFKKIKMRPYYI